MIQKSAFRSRRAFTLVELLVVVSLTGVFLAMIAIWVGETMRFSSRMKNHQLQHQQLNRLSWALRGDVQKCTSMHVDGNKLTLKRGDDWQVDYTIDGNKIHSETSVGDEVRQERYLTTEGTRISWGTAGLPDAIELIVLRRDEADVLRSGNPEDKSKAETSEFAEEADQPDDERPAEMHIVAYRNRWPVNQELRRTNGGGYESD